jgi:Family of unknown function (DUF6114)
MATPSAQGRSIYADPSYPATATYILEPRPQGAAFLIGIGAMFVVLEGLFFLFVGTFAVGPTYGVLGGALISAGFADAIVGALLFGVALLTSAEPHHHVANGLLAIVLVVLSLLFGFGGFFIGAFLALVGALWAIFWTPRGGPVVVTVTPATSQQRS